MLWFNILGIIFCCQFQGGTAGAGGKGRGGAGNPKRVSICTFVPVVKQVKAEAAQVLSLLASLLVQKYVY